MASRERKSRREPPSSPATIPQPSGLVDFVVNAETVDVLPAGATGTTKWEPKQKEELFGLLDQLKLAPDSAHRLTEEALGILSRCLPPTERTGRVTGLVFGYVQSGKTMSFTTVAALARDNGYQLVIVIAGTSLPLLDQSTRRLERDLRLVTRPDRKWLHFESDSLTAADRSRIRDALADWHDPHVPPSQRKTVLVTVMKHHEHLQKLIDVLKGLDLAGVPALVVDDEADQASLNNYARRAGNQQSATYQRLLALRDALPSHSFLQYTATPQAPLLLSIIDTLSPNFAELLTPGAGYVGGKDFFGERSPYVKIIPDKEIPTAQQPLHAPPKSLLDAMRVFFLGVAAGIILEEGRGHRSMMVHPSQQQAGHSEYFGWVTATREQWKRLLDPQLGMAADRDALIKLFKDAEKELRRTVPELPPFEQLVQQLPYAIRSTRVEKVNAADGPTPNINWSSAYAFILVGGQAMDRGFTVEGLTVTYMPRGIGVGNADTVQQRARFFGYKRHYLGYCRVYLENAARDAYMHYVQHEEHMRKALRAHRESGRPLDEWRRAFFLNRSLKPTRRSVLKLDYATERLGDAWFWIGAPHEGDGAVAANRREVEAFRARLSWRLDVGHPNRSPTQCHRVDSDVPLASAYRDLLANLRVTRLEDSQSFTALLVLIESYLEKHPDVRCTVYEMSRWDERERGTDSKGVIKNLFQGSNPVSPRPGQPLVYPGDRQIRATEGVTIQLHRLRIKNEANEVIAVDVPTVAVWIPSELSQDVVVQKSGSKNP